jgi:YVTN family beta-propeller protein
VEYLTTYGWAIVAIAVALGVLYSLGIFGLGASGSTGCSAIEGFSCTAPVLYSSGALTTQFGQIGPTKTISATGCTTNDTAPTGNNWLGVGGITIQSGQTANLTFSCPVSGTSSGGQLGAVYTGTLWIQYTTSSSGGQTITQQVGVVRLPITESGSPLSFMAYAGLDKIGYGTSTLAELNSSPSATSLVGTPSLPAATGGAEIAVNPAGTIAYTLSTASSSVGVAYLGPTTPLTTSIALSFCVSPDYISFSPTGAFAYVACGSSGRINVINVATNTVSALVTVGSNPFSIAFNPAGTQAWVVNYGTGTGSVSVINTATNTVTTTFNLGTTSDAAEQVAFSPTYGYAYITDASYGMWQVNTTTHTKHQVAIFTGPYGCSLPFGVAFNPTGNLAYVSCEYSGQVLALGLNATNSQSPQNLGLINVGPNPYYLTFNPTGSVALVVDTNQPSGPSYISAINPVTSNVMTVSLGSGIETYQVAIAP